jgi:hypothetical protein
LKVPSPTVVNEQVAPPLATEAVSIVPSEPISADPDQHSLVPVESISAYLQQQQINYQAVQTLHQQGLTLRRIAEQLQINVNTVNKYVHLPAPPAKQHRTTLKLIGHEAFFYLCPRGGRSTTAIFV